MKILIIFLCIKFKLFQSQNVSFENLLSMLLGFLGECGGQQKENFLFLLL